MYQNLFFFAFLSACSRTDVSMSGLRLFFTMNWQTLLFTKRERVFRHEVFGESHEGWPAHPTHWNGRTAGQGNSVVGTSVRSL